MKGVLALLCVLLGACATARALVPAQPARYDFSAVDARLAGECASGHFAGIAVVRVDDREVYSRTCGTADVDAGTPITRDSRFKIYSMSKLLTALAIMRLVELDRMGLDAPVARYVPDLPATWGAVTIRQLLQHTSGLPDLTQALLEAYTTDHPSAMRVVLADTAKAAVPPAFTPGEKWRYNNFGYELLADAGARAAGVPFEQVLQEQVFDRAGMRDAVVDRIAYTEGKRHSAADPRLVRGYNGKPGELKQALSYSFVQLGAGSAFATIDDLLALDRAIAGGRVVSADTWRAMTGTRIQTMPDDPTRGWGLGMALRELNGMRMQSHSGGTNGYISNFVRYPESNAVLVVLSNRGFARPQWMAEAVATVLEEAGSRQATR